MRSVWVSGVSLSGLVVAVALAGCGDGSRDSVDASAGHTDGSVGPSATPVVVMPTTTLAALAGPLAKPAAGQEHIGFYGTDLGVSLLHQGELRFLFGDTWSDATGTAIGTTGDDAQGSLPATGPGGFPDGDSVDAYVAAHPAPPGGVPWRNDAPPLEFALGGDGKIAPIELYRDGDTTRAPLAMGLGKTVDAAFSNGRDGAFAIFRRDVVVACTNSVCADGFACDTGMGFCSNTNGEFARPCIAGTTRCGLGAVCVVPEGGGLCQDQSSSVYGTDEDGRLDSVVVEHEVGNADPVVTYRYATIPWRTNEFLNPIAKTAEDFNPERDDPRENDYRAATGEHPERERVLLWGRPRSVGVQAQGHDARLYFAYVAMPEYGTTGPSAWAPRYFTGEDHGRPVFSADPGTARALDLSGGASPQFEVWDDVDKMSISYVAPLRLWVMFYGGDLAPLVLSLFVGPSSNLVKRDPAGAIHARFAEHPWGPWSAPVPVLEAGDPDALSPLPGSEYAPGGVLHHPGCTSAACTPATPAPAYALTPYGFLYAPNIVDSWTEARGDGSEADVYWNVSTWNPYESVLLRTRLKYP